MIAQADSQAAGFDGHFKIFHELMPKKVREILLVSRPYDAWIMEEDCRLSERIINEYRGLNLSHPPRLTWVSSAEEAWQAMQTKSFDLVITMPWIGDTDGLDLGRQIKDNAPELPVILLSHNQLPSMECRIEDGIRPDGVDYAFIWTGNTDLLVALVKSVEDRMNVDHDTASAGIRVILMVEDSPEYVSSLLPLLYKELVSQTQAVMEEGLNEEHRLLTMRARPKILLAECYEEALSLFEKFEPYVLGVISDVRFPRNGEPDANAGVDFLKRIKKERFDIPLLLASAEPSNAEKAFAIPVPFVDKNSPTLQSDVRNFVKKQLGFGHFVFRMPDGSEIARAANMRTLEQMLHTIPDESFVYHCSRNDFSRWLFARTETVLASMVRPITNSDFKDIQSHREYLIAAIHNRRKIRQKGIVANFDVSDFDLVTEFFKIGNGSLGGKARGLAFVASLLRKNQQLHNRFSEVNLIVPQTLVITTEGFDAFTDTNDLKFLAKTDLPDEQIAKAFLKAEFPTWIANHLRAYLAKINYPLAIRSSSLLEDAQFRAYAGLYATYMLPNDHPNLETRLEQLITAIKLVYASTYYQGPKAFSRRVGHRTEEEQMAVIIQQMVGEHHQNWFYPAISGVAQSYNYYPFARMTPEDGIATIALGLGRMVMEGEKTLRFCPAYPQLLPQRSTVDDILQNSQRFFYALKMNVDEPDLGVDESLTLEKRELFDALGERPISQLASTYSPQEHRIRDTAPVAGSSGRAAGHPVLTFAPILKYNQFPLADLLQAGLAMGQEGMGCPVEMEFSVNLNPGRAEDDRPEFAFLQLRPMTARAELAQIDISEREVAQAFCISDNALGNAVRKDMADIIYVKPDVFDPAQTREIARQIGRMNAELVRQERRFLLIGSGRWGSADHWLGIPVGWADISGVGAIVEAASDKIQADPSQGSHFFHNITTMGINYITIAREGNDLLDWPQITGLPILREDVYVAHTRLDDPLTLKVDGRLSRCVAYFNSP